MITPVSSTAQLLSGAHPAAPTEASSSTKPRAAPADTVTISGGNAMQEALETPVQTIQEAAAGDLQARHLLARETAAAKAA
jgi:hypothetical protein